MRLNKKGQGLIEALWALTLALLIILGTATLLHRLILFYLADYHAHEATLCGVSQKVDICKTELQRRIKPFLFKDRTIKFSLTKNRKTIFSRLEIDTIPTIKIEKQYDWVR